MARPLPIAACFCRTGDVDCREGRLCPYRRQPLGEEQAPAQFTLIRYPDGVDRVLDSAPTPLDATFDTTPTRTEREAQWSRPATRPVGMDRSSEALGWWLLVAVGCMVAVVYANLWPAIKGMLG